MEGFDIVSYLMGRSAGGGGGGQATVVAAVKAVANDKYTVTAEKGDLVITASHPGTYVFLIPEVGTWTFWEGDHYETLDITANNVYSFTFPARPR